MAYDEHWNDGSPGPIASLPWFASVLRQRQRDIPAEKMIVAIGNYAYDWGRKASPAEERTFEEAVLIAKESEGKPRLDPASLNPTFSTPTMTIAAITSGCSMPRRPSTSWSPCARCSRAASPCGGLAVRIRPCGRCSAGKVRSMPHAPRNWPKFVSPTASTTRARAKILEVTAQPQIGRRTIKFDAQRGLISGERFTAFPSPYVITRHGSAERTGLS
jgi:hypothetical protein